MNHARLLKAKHFFPLIVLILVLSFSGQSRATADEAGFRGAQISVLEGNDWKSCREHFQKLKKAGFDTIILRVFHNPGDRFHGPEDSPEQPAAGVYFKTSCAPLVSDLLAPACQHAHTSGLKIFAWMTTLSADYDGHTRDRVLSYSGKHLPLKPENRLMEPTAAATRSFLEKLFQDLAGYPLDGILLQDDLVLRHCQGFKIVNGVISPDPNQLYLFDSRGKIDGYTEVFTRWRQAQARQLEDLTEAIFRTIRQVNPQIRLALNLNYEFLFNPAWSLNWFACDQATRERTSADYLMVMNYQERMAREMEISISGLETKMTEIFAQARKFPYAEKLVFKFEQPTTGNYKLSTLVAAARRQGWRRFALFPCNQNTGFFPKLE